MRLNRKYSIIFTMVYFTLTLLGRFYVEPYLAGHYWISIGIGVYFLLVFWVLVKKKFLNFAIPGEENE